MPIHDTPGSSAQELLTTLQRVGIAPPILYDISSIVIDSAIRSSSRLAALLNHMPRYGEHQMTLELLIPVCNIAHDILSLPRLDPGSRDGGTHWALMQRNPVTAAAELVRVSALALISTVITTTSGDNLYCAVYRRGLGKDLLLYTKAEGWVAGERLKLWVMVVQVIMATESTRDWFLDEIMDTIYSLSLRSWEDLLSCLGQVAWVAHAATQGMARLKSDIEQRLARTANARWPI